MKFDLICISSIEMTTTTTSQNGDGRKKGGLFIAVGVIAGIAVVSAVVFFILYLRYVL